MSEPNVDDKLQEELERANNAQDDELRDELRVLLNAGLVAGRNRDINVRVTVADLIRLLYQLDTDCSQLYPEWLEKHEPSNTYNGVNRGEVKP